MPDGPEQHTQSSFPLAYFREKAKRSWPVAALSAIWGLVGLLAEHRVLSWLNDFLDEHSRVSFLAKPLPGPTVLLGVAGLVLVFRTVLEGRRRKETGHAPGGHHQIAPEPATTIKQEASPVITASPIITASPSFTHHAHFYPPGQYTPPPATRIESQAAAVELQGHNVSFAGVSKCRSNAEEEIIKNDYGNLALKACFINPPKAGKQIEDAHRVRVRAVFRNEAGDEVAEVSSAKWLRHGTDDSVRIRVNTRECLLLAMWYPTIGWHAPFLVQGSEPYMDGERDYSIEHHPPPNEKLTVEITAVDGNNVGLNPVSVQIQLSAGGTADILASKPVSG